MMNKDTRDGFRTGHIAATVAFMSFAISALNAAANDKTAILPAGFDKDKMKKFSEAFAEFGIPILDTVTDQYVSPAEYQTDFLVN